MLSALVFGQRLSDPRRSHSVTTIPRRALGISPNARRVSLITTLPGRFSSHSALGVRQYWAATIAEILGARQGPVLVTGNFISAEEALARGLVNRVVDAADLDTAVEALVGRIVGKPRVALALGKQLFYRQLEVGINAAYTDASRTMASNMMDASALEGVQAFIDKRKPDWKA